MLHNSKEQLRQIVLDLQSYIEKKIELKSLEFQEKGAKVAAAAISNFLGIVLLLVGLFFLLVTAGLGLGELLGSVTLGFLALSLILIIIGGYIYATKRNALKKKLERQIGSFLDNVLSASASEAAADDSPTGSATPKTPEPAEAAQKSPQKS